MNIDVLISVFVFVIGLLFGSFYNVVGYRLPDNQSIAFPNSHCPNCKHQLKFYELIPLISYIFLGGKCRVCKKRISIIYPFFELLTGILFLLSYMVFGLSIEFAISITFISILIIVSISDVRYYIIPDEVLIVGIIILLIEYILKCFIMDLSFFNTVIYPILNGLASFAILYLFKILGDFLFKKESLGGGDIKLLFLIGLVLGFDMGMLSIFIAAFIALPFSFYTLLKEDINVLPFGPYLSIASVIILLMQLDLNMVLDLFI